ncbi:uncharacterized protein LOC113233268 [Hyposmocoma kahamanoa]|uniref:uncharacterized protein LOC113233268 n=1 Tax=Hyposmocoma kahamanoa TaxID=1477025 RepID=UPI000E6D7DE1|nr:uncharacterized protein LOC113233268 [Hyposmocoma kahamanoa]
MMRKPELLMLVKRHKPEALYEIDQILGDHGHTVARLPPYHCHLNPIELIWGIAKHKIASVNVGSIDIKMAAEQAFQAITAEDWKNSCQHVIKIEKEYYERGMTMYDDIEKLVINVRDESSSETTSDSCDSDEFVVAGTSSQDTIEFSGVEYLDESVLESD